MEAKDFLDVKYASSGQAAGPQLAASLFLRPGMGIVFTDASGAFYRLSLNVDGSGNAILDNNGQPTISLQQVTI